MSNQKKEKVIHVDNLVIHAQNVDFVREQPHRDREELPRDPWAFFWGRPREEERLENESSSE
ncbi:hypothetical protein MHB50_02475 [Siminovitchia sp. FSL H7-0308]|uniref:Uncharacterized protein n=1 Tax=Siminovitchia thermophila TaxID=1245522 RepID=A0ABS2R2H5_9BACI|nr:hypothetical protein [Siminovitchia thermophila]MBM7713837.1 hypothetical protein [Siminovitchia thermophila]ONK22527.1 hypothetical protein BLX87_16015 [Bacillus sp. VT-16-64]